MNKNKNKIERKKEWNKVRKEERKIFKKKDV